GTPVPCQSETDVGTAGTRETDDGMATCLDSTGMGFLAIGKAASATVVTFEAGPYTYRGTAFTATAHVTGVGGLDAAVTPVVYTRSEERRVGDGWSALANRGRVPNHKRNSASKETTPHGD